MLISCNVLDQNIQFINLYSGFNVGEVVDSGENGFPLVLLCKFSVGQLEKDLFQKSIMSF